MDKERFEVIKMNLLHRHVNESDIDWLISTVEEQQKEIDWIKLERSSVGEIVRHSESKDKEIVRLQKELERLQTIEQAYEAMKKSM